MEMLEKLPSEVLIYLQNVRKYLSTNEHTRTYFKIDSHEKEFFDEVTEISHENFKTTGEAQLTIAQFEQIRRKVLKENNSFGTFQSLGDLGFISLN